MAEGKSIEETDSLRIDGLFLAFVVITLLYGKLTELLEHNLKGKTRRGLRHAVHHIEEELLALGLISLLLIVAEEYLIEICVDADGHKDDSKSKKSDKEGDHRRLSRRLLAGGDDGNGSCSKGNEPFWSAQTIHQTHIFIFLIAVTHVLYATVSILICLWRMYRWRKYENSDHSVKQLQNPRLVYGQNTFDYWFWSFWAQFSPKVDESLYLSMRFLFIERMEFPDDFDFLSFVVNTLVEEFGIVVRTDWVMWVVAAVWILVPQFLVITTAAAVIIVLVAGTKLEVVGVKLTQMAYLAYGSRTAVKHQPIAAPTRLITKSMYQVGQRLSRASGSQGSHQAAPNLGTQSLSIFRPGKDQTEPQHVERRAHSFIDGNLPRSDQQTSNAPPPQDQQEVEIAAPVDNTAGVSEKELVKGSIWNFLKFKKKKCALARTDTDEHGLPDSANLFWFKNPQLILRALRFVYFETAMAIALVLFDYWQDSRFIIEDTDMFGSKWLMMCILIGVGVLCLIQTSFLMLPTYALTTVAGSHCPETILRTAAKFNIETSYVNEIQQMQEVAGSGQIDMYQNAGEKGQRLVDIGNGDDDDEEDSKEKTISSLVGAMYRGKLQRLLKQQRRAGGHGPSTSLDLRFDGQGSNGGSVGDEEQLSGIVAVFGSFEIFLEDVRRSQLGIAQVNRAAVFNFDCDVGSFDGKEITPYDRAAINLTWDLKAARHDVPLTSE